jgi:hypothetical protein
MARTTAEAISNLLARAAVHGIVEAHLPMAMIEGFTKEPEEILVVVGQSQERLQVALPVVGKGLAKILPPTKSLGLLPMTIGDPLVQLVRQAGCKIFPLD